MTEENARKLRLDATQKKQALLGVAALCVLLAAWLGFNGWQQYRQASAAQSLQQTRDGAVQDTSTALATALQQLQTRLASAPVQGALAAGDLDAAGAALGEGWAGAQHASVLPPDFDAAYASLPESGYGRLAALEAAMVANAAVATLVQTGDGPRLALTAPARAGQALVGVAHVQLPAKTVGAAVAGATIDPDGYLALRQGSHTIAHQGDVALAGDAQTQAVAIPDSRMRIVMARPDADAGPFGLGAGGCFIGAGALLLLAGLAAMLALRGKPAAETETDEDAADAAPEQTLHEALQDTPKPEAAPAVATAAGVAAAAGTGTTVVEADGSAAATPAAADVAAADDSDGPIAAGIFRAYDIRGVVGQTLDRDAAELIGRAIGSLMHDKGLEDIVVGRDGRLSGPDMVAGLVEGLQRTGCNVIDIGLAPTPVVYFAAYHLGTGSCVSVTGSHNPPDYNGFKIVVGGETLSGDAITDLYTRITGERLHEAGTPGSVQQRNVDQDYIDRIASDVQLDRRLRVVVDAGNGVAGDIAPKVLAAIGADVTELYCEVDGTFPNHHPDPSEEKNLRDLVTTVEGIDADLGVAFDGDGDRLGVVTRDGKNIFADRLLMLFAADVLERNPGAMIVYDVKCTGRLPGHILRHGGSPLMWKTGHSLIKAKMRETEAELAGEMSGHFFFKERWYGFDDGIYAAARLLEILAARAEAPGEVLNALPDGVSTAEIKVDAPGGNPHAFVDKFRQSARFEGARLSTIDGLRVDWPDGWGLVRASNTTPVLVLRFDADTREALTRIQDTFREQLLAVDPQLALPF